MPGDPKDRRRARRVTVKELYVECSEASFWNFLKKPEHETHPLVNISQSGLQMLSSVGFAMSLPIDVVILHPNRKDVIKARGKVVYSRILQKKVRGQTLFKIGVQFTKFKQDELDKLALLMADRSVSTPQPE
ncbi:MAG: PilZ domain-containing protein [Planctomycetota bacterium]|nr:PilZ domain-containing protein [Planctomycetota bacterium]